MQTKIIKAAGRIVMLLSLPNINLEDNIVLIKIYLK
jgi:hypothetical protein